MTAFLSEYLKENEEKLEELVKAHPVTLSVGDVAEFLGGKISAEIIKTFVEQHPIFGTSYLALGGKKRVTYINTPMFVRWVLLQEV